MKIKAYIIHVSTATNRKMHMLEQLKNKNIDYEFILKGDITDIADEVINKYFYGVLASATNLTSCNYKHIMAYEKIVDNNIDYAIIFEDDIFLYKDFDKEVENILFEIKKCNYNNFIISLEESNLKYVKGSEKKKNKVLYKKTAGRMAGAYLIDKQGAKSLLKYVTQYKCNVAIDWIHNYCADKGMINIYWPIKPIALQGSLNGKIKSILESKPNNRKRVISFKLQRIYKKILFRLR